MAAPPLFSPALTKDAADAVNDEEAYEAVEEEEEEEEEEEAFNPYLFIAGLPAHHTVVIRDKICLPPLKGAQTRPTLALDLDETLVHCTVEPIAKPDLTFPVTFNGTFYQVYVRKRPYLDYFLETVSKSFEVVVFTASQKVYADVLLDLLDPEHKYIEHRLFREACLFVQVCVWAMGRGRACCFLIRFSHLTGLCSIFFLVQGNYLKDLTVLGRDMTKVRGPGHTSPHPAVSLRPLFTSRPASFGPFVQSVLVDNSPHAYGYDIDNGIPIESWFDDESDTELLKLIGFLRNVVDADDVRPIVREHFKSYELVKNATLGYPPVTSSPPF